MSYKIVLIVLTLENVTKLVKI